MCGLGGVYNSSGLDSDALARPLERMSALLEHRGPDEYGSYMDEKAAFVHRRLSILDLKTGQQPMCSQDGRTIIVFNGEIFNFRELRQSLEKDGAAFRTHSDTEVIVHLYGLHGLDFVHFLNGQFAIAIRDLDRDILVLARDRVGICPLYYTRNGAEVAFASEIKALIPVMGRTPSISPLSLDEIFTFWSPQGPNTIFENISQVKPGCLVVMDGNEFHEFPYWDWKFPEDGGFLQDSAGEIAEELRSLLSVATTIRLRSDVPVGGYLSGGLDSSILLALIMQTGTGLNSFSINFHAREFDEGQFQQDVIAHLNTNHRSVLCGSQDIAAGLVKAMWHIECPILRAAPVPMGILSGLARDSGYKVVLTGEGADEVFCGYDLFREAKVRRFWARYPDSDFRASLLKRLYPYLDLPAGRTADYLKAFFGQGLQDPEDLCFSHLPRWTTTARGKRFFSDSTRSALVADCVERFAKSLPQGLQKVHPLNRAQYIEAKTLMAGYLLSSQGDRMLMMNSVEGRFPFLDHTVIDYANRIPPELKLRVLNEKHILKVAFEKDVPDSVVRRYKQPYRTPEVTESASLLSEEARDLLSSENVRRVDLFDSKKVEFLVRKVDTGKRLTNTEAQTLMGVLTTQVIESLFISKFEY